MGAVSRSIIMVPLDGWNGVERRASMCADCKTVRGEPISNLIASGQQTLTFRCPSCGREWTHTKPDPSERIDR